MIYSIFIVKKKKVFSFVNLFQTVISKRYQLCPFIFDSVMNPTLIVVLNILMS